MMSVIVFSQGTWSSSLEFQEATINTKVIGDLLVSLQTAISLYKFKKGLRDRFWKCKLKVTQLYDWFVWLKSDPPLAALPTYSTFFGLTGQNYSCAKGPITTLSLPYLPLESSNLTSSNYLYTEFVTQVTESYKIK